MHLFVLACLSGWLVAVVNSQGSSSSSCGSTPAVPMVIRAASSVQDTLPDFGTSGVIEDILTALQAKPGVPPVKLTPLQNVSYANKNSDGTWASDSLIGLLVNNQTDLIGPDVFATSDRVVAVDFLAPIYEFKVQILFNTQYGITPDTVYYYSSPEELRLICFSTNDSAQAACKALSSRGPEALMPTNDAGLAKVLSGNFGFIEGSPYFDLMVPKQGGKVAVRTILNIFAGFAVQKGSPLRNLLNVPLLQLAENGDIQQIFANYGIPT